jgi:DNA-binding transcriptional LysR family regulator
MSNSRQGRSTRNSGQDVSRNDKESSKSSAGTWRVHITLRQLSVFDAVARTGSVSQAAAEIFLSQSAASLSLKELEKHLGCSLFERHGKKLVLNGNGQRLHPQAHSLLRQAQDFYLDNVPDHAVGGRIVIGATAAIGEYLLPIVCGRFLSKYTGVEITLRIGSSQEVVSMVDDMFVDIGVIEGPCHQNSLISQSWINDRLVYFVAPQHRLAGHKSVSVRELEQDVWCVEPQNFSTRSVSISALLSHFREVKIGFVSSNIEAIKGTVRSGTGVGCLSHFALKEDLERGTLVELPLEEIRISRVFSIVRRNDEYYGRVQTAFLEYINAQSIADLYGTESSIPEPNSNRPEAPST